MRSLTYLAVSGFVVIWTLSAVDAQGAERRMRRILSKIDKLDSIGLLEGRTGNVCTEDLDCPDNAFCRQNSYCVCKDGFVYVADGAVKACLKVGMFGDPCTQHIQCHTMMGLHSECNQGACACKPETQLVDDRCYKTAVVGERCVVDHNCFLSGAKEEPGAQAFCVRGYCTCQLNYSPRDNGTRCVKDANLGEPCEDQEQCAGVGLECRDTCRCKDGWVVHNDTRSCVKMVPSLNEPCEFDVQCDHLSGVRDPRFPSATICMVGSCECTYAARQAGTPSRCWNVKRPGQECVNDEECLSEEDEPGYCLNGRCTCKNCVPDSRDFGGATIARPVPLAAAILLSAAILKSTAILA